MMHASPSVAAESGRSRAPRKRAAKLILLALVLAAVVPPFITLKKFRNSLESTMSAAVGRKVTVQEVHLRLLPQPGFELKNFAIEDDPAFSQEPLLRATSVVAGLRLTSLWRGRIEVSRLDLSSPSLNLARAADGRWNIEELLAYASQVPAAPTGREHAGVRPRFPYIQAEGGRVNFKAGAEKKVFAFADADFAFWLASENEWQMRLSGRPVRTDADLSDTGEVQITGSFTRSPEPRQTPLNLQATWRSAQLGEVSKLFDGRERGWRGNIDARAQLSGSPEALNISADATVQDFHRYDINTNGSFQFSVNCDGIYWGGLQHPQPALRGSCRLPEQQGSLNVSGEYSPADGSGGLTLMAANFPASTALLFLRNMKRGIAPDLQATGEINGRLRYRRGNAPIDPNAVLQGGRQTSTMTAKVVLASKTFAPQRTLDLGVLILNFEQPAPRALVDLRRFTRAELTAANAPTALTLLPAKIQLGGAQPVFMNAVVNASGYTLNFAGSAATERVAAFLDALGLSDPQLASSPKGIARVDLNFDGAWKGFAPPTEVGSIHMQAPATLARKLK